MLKLGCELFCTRERSSTKSIPVVRFCEGKEGLRYRRELSRTKILLERRGVEVVRRGEGFFFAGGGEEKRMFCEEVCVGNGSQGVSDLMESG